MGAERLKALPPPLGDMWKQGLIRVGDGRSVDQESSALWGNGGVTGWE